MISGNERLSMLKDEIMLIRNADLRTDVAKFLVNEVPDYFFVVPASSSGKYHPSFSQGQGGLLRHTKMVVEILFQLKPLYDKFDNIYDSLIAAAIIHDTFKHGWIDKGHTVKNHEEMAAEKWKKFVEYKILDKEYSIVYHAVRGHMGQWGVDYEDYKNVEHIQLVHLADYITSRKFFDLYKE